MSQHNIVTWWTLGECVLQAKEQEGYWLHQTGRQRMLLTVWLGWYLAREAGLNEKMTPLEVLGDLE